MLFLRERLSYLVAFHECFAALILIVRLAEVLLDFNSSCLLTAFEALGYTHDVFHPSGGHIFRATKSANPRSPRLTRWPCNLTSMSSWR